MVFFSLDQIAVFFLWYPLNFSLFLFHSGFECRFPLGLVFNFFLPYCQVEPKLCTEGQPCWLEVTSGDTFLDYAFPPFPRRHDKCFVFDPVSRKGYLIGGVFLIFETNFPVGIWDAATRTWSSGQPPPIPLHHMQCVVADGKIWIASAWTGTYPFDENAPNIYIYDPATDSWSTKGGLPEERKRGAGAAVLVDRRIYVSHGNVGGHGSHATCLNYLDYYDIDADTWVTNLPDAPNARDHVMGGLVTANGNNLLCVGAGRDGGVDSMDGVILPTDCFDLNNETWAEYADIPQGRAGFSGGTTCDGKYIVAGGEGFGQTWPNVEVFDGATWTAIDDLVRPRHGTDVGFDCECNQIILAGGSGNQGGTPFADELLSVEILFPNGVDEICSDS